MCGIVGAIGVDNVADVLLQGLKNLEYRGYDSCGMAILNNGKISIRKDTGTVEEVNTRQRFHEMKGGAGIAHTRWATHGKVNQVNSHPHLSQNGKFAIIHNGIISNYLELKSFLHEQGFSFQSETDTEVAANMMEYYFSETNDVELAIRKTAQRLEGSYGFLVLSVDDPDHIYAVRLESPLMIGLGTHANFLGSDANAFLAHTRNAIPLDDGEYAIIGKDTHIIRKIVTGQRIERKSFTIPWDMSESRLGGFPHYMLKEIHEQPQIIGQALAADPEKIATIAKEIVAADRAYLIGVGTTFYVSQFGQYMFHQIANLFVPAVSSDEFEYTANAGPGTLTLASSQSGETYDTIRALRYAQDSGGKTAAVVNVVGSSMSRQVDWTVAQGSGPEICVISTKAAVAQMIILTRIALEAASLLKRISAEEREEIETALHALSSAVRQIINERSGTIRNLANNHLKVDHWLFLGKGLYYPVAMESALKMKEVSYVHSEGMPAGFLKHGTLALIDGKVNTMVFMPDPGDEKLFAATSSAAEEVKARQGHVVGICFRDEQYFDEAIVLKSIHPKVNPLLQIIVGQLFSYFTAVSLGRNIDKPRSLAKSVTVP